MQHTSLLVKHRSRISWPTTQRGLSRHCTSSTSCCYLTTFKKFRWLWKKFFYSYSWTIAEIEDPVDDPDRCTALGCMLHPLVAAFNKTIATVVYRGTPAHLFPSREESLASGYKRRSSSKLCSHGLKISRLSRTCSLSCIANTKMGRATTCWGIGQIRELAPFSRWSGYSSGRQTWTDKANSGVLSCLIFHDLDRFEFSEPMSFSASTQRSSSSVGSYLGAYPCGKMLILSMWGYDGTPRLIRVSLWQSTIPRSVLRFPFWDTHSLP